MNAKPLAAFGYVAYLVDVEANEVREVGLNEHGFSNTGYYYYVKGQSAVSVIETGEVLETRTAGWLNIERPEGQASSTGTVRSIALEDSQWLCMPHAMNPKGLPNLSSLILSPGETRTLAQATDLYLVRGTLVVGDRTFVGPRQIRIRSGDVTALSQDQSYSLIFQ